MKKLIAAASALLGLAACTTTYRYPAPAPLSAERISEVTRTLASEEFQGRAMGTPGEERTVAYLTQQFQRPAWSRGARMVTGHRPCR